MELDQEKFETAKVLADLGQKIAEGRAVLKQLIEETEAYIVEREEMVLKRVKSLLKSSSDALMQVTKHHDELKRYASEVSSFADSVSEFHKKVMKLHGTLDEEVKNHEKDISAFNVEFEDRKRRLLEEKIILEADREALQRKSNDLNKKSIALNDQEKRLERGFEELKTKKT